MNTLRTALVVVCAVAVMASATSVLPRNPPRFVDTGVATPNAIVNTPLGKMQGLTNDMANTFLGIRYAEAPTGDNRWANTIPSGAWPSGTTYNATTFSAGCPQLCNLPPGTCPEVQSEDCLFINVYTPLSASEDAPVPVMLFLPGGRFEQGSAMTYLYDGSYFVNTTNTVMVVANYRLGALGWMVTDELAGNYGYMDQVTVLKWIQANIKSFGGDPTKVTLFGQSAGGTSTSAHLTQPGAASQALFSQAIIESNPFSLFLKTPKDAQKTAKRFAKDVSCDMSDTACLRAVDVHDVLEAQAEAQNHIPIPHPLNLFYPWTPNIDGTLLTMQPIDAFQQGQFYKVPLMVGTVLNDAWLFINEGWGKPLSKTEYEAVILGVFLLDGIKILERYPCQNATDCRPEMSLLGTHYIFYCPARAVANAMSAAGSPTYFYRFDHVIDSFNAWGPNYTFCQKDYVCHGSELPFLFDSPQYGNETFNSGETLLSHELSYYWGSFGATGNPNTNRYPGAIEWPEWTAASADMLFFNVPTDSVSSDPLADTCEFWNKVGYE